MGAIADWFKEQAEGLVVGVISGYGGGKLLEKVISDYLEKREKKYADRIADRVYKALEEKKKKVVENGNKKE